MSKATKKSICVLGSINIDFVINISRIPKFGETIFGDAFHVFPGGKGANQAVAAGRLGANVHMLGMVGNDEFGKIALNSLEAAGVKTDAIEIEKEYTGIASIQIDSSGQNSIVVVSGANAKVDVSYIHRHISIIEDCDILLLQLELPFDTVCNAIDTASLMKKTIILDPGPARKLPNEVLEKVSILTPNEIEMRTIVDDGDSEKSVLECCKILKEKGCVTVLNKAGGSGAYLYKEEILTHFPAYQVDVVDTTAAGDSFNAALACALALDKPLVDAIIFANAAGAIATTKMGAQSAMPSIEECIFLINQHNKSAGEIK